MKFTLQEMAQAGYIMGLETIGEVASHMDLHYDVHFSIENYAAEVAEFNALIEGHLDDSIELYLTEEDKLQMDAELDAAMGADPPQDYAQ